jgi:50S ribosomal subunit-associated GTPase HflX
VVTVFNKCDRIAALPPSGGQDSEGLRVSALTGEGIDSLRAEISRRLPELATGYARRVVGDVGESAHAALPEGPAVTPLPAPIGAVLED